MKNVDFDIKTHQSALLFKAVADFQPGTNDPDAVIINTLAEKYERVDKSNFAEAYSYLLKRLKAS